MRLKVAIYHAVHDFPEGVEVLAGLMGLAHSTLQNMANPRQTTHNFSLKQLDQLIHFTGDPRIVEAFCFEHGGLFVPAGGLLNGSGGDVFRKVSKAAKEFGDVVAEIEAAVADGRVSKIERDRTHQQAYELHQAVFALEQHVDAMAEQPGSTLRSVS